MINQYDQSFFGHPRGLSTLFFTEMWERFTYYGMRAILILFMTAGTISGGMGFDVAKAGAIYGTYTAMVYLLSLPGGWIADRILGARRSVLHGGIIIMIGNLLLAFRGDLLGFYLGLSFMVIGAGLLKPNVSVLVGQLYSEKDIRRDSGFSIYYMGINIGSFISPLVCGWFAQSKTFATFLQNHGINPAFSWHWGFGAAAFGMFLGLVQYIWGSKYLNNLDHAHLAVRTRIEQRNNIFKLWFGTLILVVIGVALLVLVKVNLVTIDANLVSDIFGYLLLAITIGFFLWLFIGNQWTSKERKRLIVVAILFFGAATFWSAFEQSGSSLNLFAERNTNTSVFGLSFPASWLQSVNPIFIIILAPVFAGLWTKLGNKNPSSLTKFFLGLFILALGFAVMIGAAIAAHGGVRVSPMWLIFTYLLLTVGELCLSPSGLSAVTKLAPIRVSSLMMGAWFLAAALGNYVGGRIAGLYESFSLEKIFGAVTGYTLLAALIVALLIRPIRRMLEQKH